MAPDSRGVWRGRCKACDECDEFTLENGSIRCAYCCHSPVQHQPHHENVLADSGKSLQQNMIFAFWFWILILFFLHIIFKTYNAS